ncbi:hypothetical protein A2797_00820 [candidate division WWE3 bacterium RIFCSPHIGHO2_01_FULL_48_15]|uniref:Phosphoribosyltransferase domain-containing protein n=1 Tax=candidate division WWE3 bacterium RIFCSPHIGHO2_01_FULL_48_15 TaxID=1802619 RepID=A0A1F4VH32_UNCKA|nr:MAG: hypothetical protein A2797_00820 [candidate division WWE3 bacterium RIFCSPHIGHO2_01_FULL_48_15]
MINKRRKLNLGEDALRVLRSYVRTLRALLVKESKQFDLVVGPGDSGAVMVKFTEYVYEALGLPKPRIISLPVFRSSEEESLPEAQQIEDLSKSQIVNSIGGRSILFVDDEIGKGEAAKITLAIIKELQEQSRTLDCVTLAEDAGFTTAKRRKIEKSLATKIEFRPFSKHKDKLYNAIFWFIPPELEDSIQHALKELNIEGDKYPMSILLNTPIKKLSNGVPVFSYEMHKSVAQKVPNLNRLQKSFQVHVRGLVQEALKNG